MGIQTAQMESWCRGILGIDSSRRKQPLESYLKAIPRLESLSDVGRGTVVLVRGDLDAKPGAKVGEGDIRLRSMVPTLEFGLSRGWIQVVFGHRGRKKEESLDKVAVRLGEILSRPVTFVRDWFDEATTTIREDVAAAIRGAAPGSIHVLENTRQYAMERVLWDTTAESLPQHAELLAKVADQFAQRLGRVYINEAFSAGSLDTSSTVVPAAMDKVALGKYVAGQFDGPLMRCIRAELVVFSGLKADKLDDLEAMLNRGTIRWIFAAGSLAMALKKAEGLLEGRGFCTGVAEDPSRTKEGFYIAPGRFEQARRMLETGRRHGTRFVLPVDFVLADGRVAETLAPADQQFDVGPRTSGLFSQKIGEFLLEVKNRAAGQPAVAFYNGVFGMFEDPRFEGGTRRFIPELKRMTQAGVEVFVGGGEGGTALERYGQPDWVSHTFTAGGTVLNAIGSEPVPYLVALAARISMQG